MNLDITAGQTTEQFVAELAKLDVKLPLALHDEEVGSVIDADKREIFVVDVHSERPKHQVEQIASWIVMAVNTCGGFKAVRS